MKTEIALLQITANGVQREYPLAHARYRIGRSSRADIQISDCRVSRFQATLLYPPEGPCLILDGNGKTPSCNGTFVNGVRVRYRQLEDQDVLFLGSPGVTAQIFLPTSVPTLEDLPRGALVHPDQVATDISFPYPRYASFNPKRS